MVFAVRDLMQDAYPELKETADRVSKAVLAEETRFAHTMEVGLEKLEEQLAEQLESFQQLTNEKYGEQIESAMIRMHEVQEAIDQLEGLPREVRKEMEDWLETIRAKKLGRLSIKHLLIMQNSIIAHTASRKRLALALPSSRGSHLRRALHPLTMSSRRIWQMWSEI